MSTAYRMLFTPFRIGPVEVQNRIGFGPHSGMMETLQGTISEQQLAYYAERVKSAPGLVTFGCQSVAPIGRMTDRMVHAWDYGLAIDGWRRLIDDCHAHGTRIFGQITHGGATASADLNMLLGPSRVADPLIGIIPKEAEEEDIQQVIGCYVQAAYNQKRAGFDGVELKMGHDGMLRQFASTFYNRRTDEYGGTLRNRARLALQVIAAVREAIGRDVALGVRLCMDEFIPGGYSLDQGVEIAKLFAASWNLDYISVGQGSLLTGFGIWPPMDLPLNAFAYMAAALKESVDLPIIYAGRVNDPLQADKLLCDGQADVINLVRAFICDPEWLNKARDGKIEDIRKCMACGEYCAHRMRLRVPYGCVQNPAAGQEATLGLGTLKPAAVPKKVAVVGGGPAGLKAAEIAARRGHRVTLFEKEADLGGQVNIAVKAPTRAELGEAIRWLARQVKQLGVEIKTGTTATAEMIGQMGFDAVVIATGAAPAKPAIAGSDQPNVLDVWDVLLERKPVGQHVVVFDADGHYKGGGVAEFLASRGKRVHVVTPAPMPLMKAFSGSAALYWQRIAEYDYTFTALHVITGISGKEVSIAHAVLGTRRLIDGVDTVVMATQDEPNDGLYWTLKGKLKEVHRIGDCVAPRLIGNAIFDAEMLAREL